MISRVPVHSGTWVAITELDTEEVARSFFLGGGGGVGGLWVFGGVHALAPPRSLAKMWDLRNP